MTGQTPIQTHLSSNATPTLFLRLIGRGTITIPEIILGVHGLMGFTVKTSLKLVAFIIPQLFSPKAVCVSGTFTKLYFEFLVRRPISVTCRIIKTW